MARCMEDGQSSAVEAKTQLAKGALAAEIDVADWPRKRARCGGRSDRKETVEFQLKK